MSRRNPQGWRQHHCSLLSQGWPSAGVDQNELQVIIRQRFRDHGRELAAEGMADDDPRPDFPGPDRLHDQVGERPDTEAEAADPATAAVVGEIECVDAPSEVLRHHRESRQKLRRITPEAVERHYRPSVRAAHDSFMERSGTVPAPPGGFHAATPVLLWGGAVELMANLPRIQVGSPAHSRKSEMDPFDMQLRPINNRIARIRNVFDRDQLTIPGLD